MLDWLLKALGLKKDPPQTPVARSAKDATEQPLPVENVGETPTEEAFATPAAEVANATVEDVAALKTLREADAAFLSSLLSGGTHTDLQKFAPHDRAFLSLLMRKAHSGDLAIPLLPEAAIKIRKLTRNPEVNIAQFVEVFKNDPALSAEILKVANSAIYGFETPTHELGQAVLRIGYNQVRAVVMMMSLRSKVLHAGHYLLESELIATLALAMARASGLLAKNLGVGEDEAFTRGLLSHLDLFVILGVAAEFNAAHKEYPVSREAMTEAVGRVGADINKLVAAKWGLDNLGYEETASEDDKAVQSMRGKISGIGLAVIEAWQGKQVYQQIQDVPQHDLSQAVVAAVGGPKL